ncbi:MAG: 50S ribosomal protein L23 [Porticoccaceae bacterium]|jgi:large subunit ribosomal protein L23|nr:50S ribosomal protein L23 [Porticoccaceae bacterium]MEA3299441.1 50S ribosomal protein L23 [Pseudomonadota bacterium]
MNKERIFKVLVAPHVSEKATIVAEKGNQVVFKVARDANKREVKAAVQQLFGVQVEDVRVANVKGKSKRTRHGIGRQSDWKKAYVRLAQGQEIDFASAE